MEKDMDDITMEEETVALPCTPILATERSDSHDVVIGLRGRHTGTVFIKTLDLWLPTYKKAVAKEKRGILEQIIAELSAQGCRFLSCNDDGKDEVTFTEVLDKKAIKNKILKHLRYKLNLEKEIAARSKPLQCGEPSGMTTPTGKSSEINPELDKPQLLSQPSLPELKQHGSAYSFANDSTDRIIAAMMKDDLMNFPMDNSNPAHETTSAADEATTTHVASPVTLKEDSTRNASLVKPKLKKDHTTGGNSSTVPRKVFLSTPANPTDAKAENPSSNGKSHKAKNDTTLKSCCCCPTNESKVALWDGDAVSEMTDDNFLQQVGDKTSGHRTLGDFSQHSSEGWNKSSQHLYILPKTTPAPVAANKTVVSSASSERRSAMSACQPSCHHHQTCSSGSVTSFLAPLMERMNHLEKSVEATESGLVSLRKQCDMLQQQNRYLRDQLGIQKQESLHLRERVAVLEHRSGSFISSSGENSVDGPRSCNW